MTEQEAKNAAKAQGGQTRPPVVTVLGHVDHGKSSILEAIREEFRITSRESGGITQHIGAYQAEHDGKLITFLDTPGHEAFSAMRSRGAKVADLALLVVAADDGVKPQTKEAVKIILEAKIPFVVVLNKIDKPEASPDRVKQELSQEGVFVEGYGGSVPVAETSALTKQGIPELLEVILLLADMEGFAGNAAAPGEGVIIEASLDARRGIVATCLVRNGTVRIGNIVGTPSAIGKVRILEDFQKNVLQEAGPSTPVLLLGFESLPKVGDRVMVFPDRGTAEAAKSETTFPAAAEEEGEGLKIVLKADVQGSLEALAHLIGSLPEEQGKVQIVRSEVGDVGEADVRFAQSAQAPIFAYRVKVSSEMRELADRLRVTLASEDVIYRVVERIQELLEQQEAAKEPEREVGKVQILATFSAEKQKQVVGGKVTEGEARKGFLVEVLREGEVIGEGKASNLQHNKQDVASVQEGQELGLLIESQVPLQVGDEVVFVLERR